MRLMLLVDTELYIYIYNWRADCLLYFFTHPVLPLKYVSPGGGGISP